MRVPILAAAVLSVSFLATSFAGPTNPPPSQPEVKHWWSCETKLKKVAKKGRVCAKDEESAIDQCGVDLCNLDLVCQSDCKCTDAGESC